MEPVTGFRPEPSDSRGTVGIIWACLVTTFLSTYTVLHLDVQTRTSTTWRTARRKFRWIMTGIFAPEVVTSIACSQWLFARALVKHMGESGWVNATMMEAHFLSMRGVAVRNIVGSRIRIGQTHLTLSDVVGSVEFRAAFPSKAIIQDKSKTDFIGKLSTCTQILWLLIQVLGRKLQGHSVSLLEVTTISYVVLAVATFTFWWQKPKDIEEPCFVDVKLNVHEEQERGLSWWRDFGRPRGTSMFAAYISSACFSAIHCAAWNYQFPTTTEKWLWRGSSIVCFVAPVTFITLASVVSGDVIFNTLRARIILGFYVFARAFLLVESFAAFRAAPASIYNTVRWAQYVAHWG
jgi:hypothetical protein